MIFTSKKRIVAKVPVSLIQLLDNAACLRVQKGLDKKTRDHVRMMEAISRHPTIENDLANWNFLDDKEKSEREKKRRGIM